MLDIRSYPDGSHKITKCSKMRLAALLCKFRLDLTNKDATLKHFDALLNDVSPFAAALGYMIGRSIGEVDRGISRRKGRI
jgi:hypothetical protein